MIASPEQYLALLVRWNEKINLVGTRDVDEIRQRHIADALAVVPHIPVDARRLIDVGSGAGLPGAIIAIARPDLQVVALEPIHKKHAFLAALRRELPLPNFDPRALRVEDLAERDFDVAVSRATFALDEWLARGRDLVREGGLILGMEGAEEIDLPPGATRHPYQLGNRSRAIITLER